VGQLLRRLIAAEFGERGDRVVAPEVDQECIPIKRTHVRVFDGSGDGGTGEANTAAELIHASPIEAVRERSEVPKRDHQIDEVVALLAHELRTPLGAIQMALHLLRKERGNLAMREYAESVLDGQTRRMTRVIEGLMDLSRIGRGKLELNKEQVDLAGLVNLAIDAVRPGIDECGHRLEVVLPPAGVIVELDPSRLEGVLINLLENAIKYTAPGGRIKVSALPESDDIVLRVRDNGIGIIPELLPRVFDSFWQSARASSYSHGGLGIGLALVRRIVEMHGGSATAKSDGLGLGSEFVVRLPRGSSCDHASAFRETSS
jgi:signal transduction histidine kinase